MACPVNPIKPVLQDRRAGPGSATPAAAFDWTGLEEGGSDGGPGSARGNHFRWWEAFDERFMQARPRRIILGLINPKPILLVCKSLCPSAHGSCRFMEENALFIMSAKLVRHNLQPYACTDVERPCSHAACVRRAQPRRRSRQ